MLIALLVAGWLLGLAVQVAIRLATGYMDVFVGQMLLCLLLCFGAGAAAGLGAKEGWTTRRGALAGIGMIGSILAGYVALTAVTWNPLWSERGNGETWLSFLIEAPFWIGLPLLTGAAMGALGWIAIARRRRGPDKTGE
jgi:hypothetical protein